MRSVEGKEFIRMPLAFGQKIGVNGPQVSKAKLLNCKFSKRLVGEMYVPCGTPAM